MAGITAAVVGGVASIAGGAIKAGAAGKAARSAGRQKAAAAAEVKRLKNSRQKIINPYAGVKSLADMAQNLSGSLSNPAASLSVATKAAEFQAEEADIALANTLDAMVATGAGAGGATALAQAALRSKRGVSASIEQQEANNEKLRAQGEQTLQAQQLSEAQRVQNIAIQEGQRTQAAEAQGKIFQFEAKEDRQNADIQYQISKETGAAQRQAQARRDKSNAIGGIFTGLGSVAMGAMSGQASSGGTLFPGKTTSP